jgi:hypothetical protein
LSYLWLFSGCESRVDVAAERTALLETDKEFADLSARAGTAESFFQYLDSAAIQITESEDVIHGRDKIFERMKPTDPEYSLLWEPMFADVSQSSDMGWTWGTYTVGSKTGRKLACGCRHWECGGGVNI